MDNIILYTVLFATFLALAYLILRVAFYVYEKKFFSNDVFYKLSTHKISQSGQELSSSIYEKAHIDIEKIVNRVGRNTDEGWYAEKALTLRMQENVVFEKILDGEMSVNFTDFAKIFSGGCFFILRISESKVNIFNKVKMKIKNKRALSGFLKPNKIIKSSMVSGNDLSSFLLILGDDKNTSGISFWTFGANIAIILSSEDEKTTTAFVLAALRGGWGIYFYLSLLYLKNKIIDLIE